MSSQVKNLEPENNLQWETDLCVFIWCIFVTWVYHLRLKVPRVFIGGNCVGGASEMLTLHNQEKLVPLMKESGASFKAKSA